MDDARHATFIIECHDARHNRITYSVGATDEDTALKILEDYKQPDHVFDRIREVVSNREYSKEKVK